MAAGPDFATPDGLYYSPLGEIAPARPDGGLTETPFRAAISDDGAKHPVTRGLPGARPDAAGLEPMVPPGRRRGDARRQHSVDGAGQSRCCVLSREGKGRVALLLSDQMWLWARGYEGGGPHLDLLRRLAHWLMKEPELEEEALRATVRGHEDRHRAPEPEGRHPARHGHRAVRAGSERDADRRRAGPFARERRRRGTRPLPSERRHAVGARQCRPGKSARIPGSRLDGRDSLRPLAEATGGTVRRIGSGGNGDVVLPRLVAMRESPVYGGSDYAAIKRNGASEVKGVGVMPLAIGFLGLLVLLGSVVSGWLYEGRGGRKEA